MGTVGISGEWLEDSRRRNAGVTGDRPCSYWFPLGLPLGSSRPRGGGVGWVFLESSDLVVIAKPLTPAALPQWPESVHAALG